MNRVAPDQARLLRALVEHSVEFVVVGGVAAQLHGWQGATADLDVAVSSDEANVDRLNAALAQVGAGEGRIGGFGTAFKTRYGRLETVRRAHAVGHYADAGRDKDRAALCAATSGWTSHPRRSACAAGSSRPSPR